MQNLKTRQKEKKDTICEHTCANCSFQNVRFSSFFIFGVSECPTFQEMFFDR